MQPLDEYCLTVLETQSLDWVLNSICPKKLSEVEYGFIIDDIVFYLAQIENCQKTDSF